MAAILNPEKRRTWLPQGRCSGAARAAVLTQFLSDLSARDAQLLRRLLADQPPQDQE